MDGTSPRWSLLLKNALVFDGTGAPAYRIGTSAALTVNMPAVDFISPGLLKIFSIQEALLKKALTTSGTTRLRVI